MNRIIDTAPLIIFVTLVAIFSIMLLRPEKAEMISRPPPPLEGLTAKDLQGQVSLVNFFASWCAPCRAEHEKLMTLAKDHNTPVYGIAYKDRKKDTEKYLEDLGNPYKKIIYDKSGRTFIDWGLSGVPETFIIGPEGNIRYHHPGVLLEEDMRQTILPLIRTLKGQQRK